MKRSAIKNLSLFKKIVGMEHGEMSKVRLVTSKWSLGPKEKLETYEKDLATQDRFWKPLIDRGAQMVRFVDTSDSAADILRPLVEGKPFVPLLVHEVVIDKKPIGESQAGSQVADDLDEAIRKDHANISELDADLKDATARRDSSLAALLRKEKETVQADLDRREDEQKRLRKLDRRIAGQSFAAWTAKGTIVTLGVSAAVFTAGLGIPLLVIAGRKAYKGVNNMERTSEARQERDVIRYSGLNVAAPEGDSSSIAPVNPTDGSTPLNNPSPYDSADQGQAGTSGAFHSIPS
jgi:hypothetical protein